MNSHLIKESLISISSFLSKQEKRKAVFMFFLVFLSSFLDVFGLASIVPVMLAASEPGYVFKNKYFSYGYNLLGFQSEKNYLIFLILAILIFFVIKTIFLIAVNYKQAKFIANIGKKIIDLQFVAYCNIPYEIFNKIGSANVINKVISIPSIYIATIIRPTFNFFNEVLGIIIVVVAILLYKPILIIMLAIVLGGASFLLYSSIKNQASAIGVQLNELRPITQTIISESFNGYIEMTLSNKQPFFRKKLFNNQRKTQQLSELAYLYSLLPVKVIEFVAILGIIVIFLYALIFNVTGGVITIIGLFSAAAYRLMPSLNRLLQSLIALKGGQYTIEQLNKYRHLSKSDFYSDSVHQLPFEHSIQFKNISYAFEEGNQKVLKNINLDIKKGEKVGFIGPSGSGKSTLMSILLRFYEEQEGNILVDGVPVNNTNIVSWRDKLGYVKQDVFIMNASIQDNITLGEIDYNNQQLQYAIEKASLSDFISTLPEGMDTILRERGSNLSGGQRQRIGIARALYKNSEVLILDEATSALDHETERAVSEAIDNLSEIKKTILIVAHRITTLKQCDRIYELRDGEIVAIKTYADLVDKYIK